MMYFNFIGQTKSAEFASRWKKALSPDSVAQGKATGQTLAQNKKYIAAGGEYSNTQKDLAYGVEKGKKLAATGKQAMLTKAASPNRTMRPTTQRSSLKVARPSSQISPKSAQSFKQGVDNAITNVNNAKVNAYKQSMKQPPLKVDASKIPNVPPKTKVNMGSIGDDVRQAMGSNGGMADNIAKGVGRGMLKKKLLIGGGIVAAGVGLNAIRKARQKKQQSPFSKFLK